MTRGIFYNYDNLMEILEKTPYSNSSISEIIAKVNSLYINDTIKIHKMYTTKPMMDVNTSILYKHRIRVEQVFSINETSTTTDMAMALNVVDVMLKSNEIDQYTIVTGNSEMLPIVEVLLAKGKTVTIISMESMCNPNYIKCLSDWGIFMQDIDTLMEK